MVRASDRHSGSTNIIILPKAFSCFHITYNFLQPSKHVPPAFTKVLFFSPRVHTGTKLTSLQSDRALLYSLGDDREHFNATQIEISKFTHDTVEITTQLITSILPWKLPLGSAQLKSVYSAFNCKPVGVAEYVHTCMYSKMYQTMQSVTATLH